MNSRPKQILSCNATAGGLDVAAEAARGVNDRCQLWLFFQYKVCNLSKIGGSNSRMIMKGCMITEISDCNARWQNGF